MRRIYLLLFGLCFGILAEAGVRNTDFFAQDFQEMAQDSDYPTEGWLTYGNGAKPTAFASNWFNADGEGPFYALLIYGDITMAMANTEFTDGSAADEWLISPEITVPYDKAALAFTACAFANKGQSMGVGSNTFKVLISDSGIEKEDFKEVIIDTNIRGSSSTEVTSKKLVAPVNGYKGKKIRVAFVVTGSNVGFTGFTNLRMGQYIIETTNLTPEVESLGSKINVDVNIGLKTPVECNYVDAELAVNGETVDKREIKKTFGSPTSNIMVMQRMQFEDAITLVDDTPVEYTLTITPRFEGAQPTILTGYVSTPGATYPSNVVIEEFTATGCGWCPRGIAALEYYQHTYPGTGNIGKAIPIGIHGYMEYTDPMSEGVEDYLARAQGLNGSASLPGAIFNRATRGLNPEYITEMEKLIAERSYNLASITSVEIPSDLIPTEAADKEVTVKFKVRNGYNTGSRPLNAAIVLVENNVIGNSNGYMQKNYYYNFTDERVIETAGSFILPYLRPFLPGENWQWKSSLIP